MSDNLSNFDHLSRFLFSKGAVRGELTQLQQTYHHILESQSYPPAVQILLGELLSATVLLTATLKFEGTITVQLHGDGPVSFAVINGDEKQQMRGLARFTDKITPSMSFQELLGRAQMIITISPHQGEKYQGIIALEQDNLAACLEDYFMRSEQLQTKIWLFTNQEIAAGFLLQAMPAHQDTKIEFEHLTELSNTLSAQECFTLDAQTILHRLFHQEMIEIFPIQSVQFSCTCSREKSLTGLKSLPPEELTTLFQEEERITLHCDYCNTDYPFTQIDLQA